MDSMYIDYQTSHLPECRAGGPDITFHYDAADHKIYYFGTTTKVTEETIWNMLENVDYKRAWFEPYIPENFYVSDAGSYPTLSWSHSSTDADSVTAYEIFRAEGHFGFFSQIDEVSATTTSYIDYDYVTGRSIKLSYKIRAKNGSVVSQFTDVQFVYGDLYKEADLKLNYEFALNQNYPNPFNPVTTINYSIPNQSFVSLKVYDTLGKEVAVLVNEEKISGNYKVEFNAETLPSGIYLYTITAGEYSDTKKLLLIK
ncbi:MAG TPA: T9SS type A sorting domain-containing protein [Ignavibacteria bacterium]|nr:T9SS type A sorting domain-containing protein [Ignavibacteria bacterium]